MHFCLEKKQMEPWMDPFPREEVEVQRYKTLAISPIDESARTLQLIRAFPKFEEFRAKFLRAFVRDVNTKFAENDDDEFHHQALDGAGEIIPGTDRPLETAIVFRVLNAAEDDVIGDEYVSFELFSPYTFYADITNTNMELYLFHRPQPKYQKLAFDAVKKIMRKVVTMFLTVRDLNTARILEYDADRAQANLNAAFLSVEGRQPTMQETRLIQELQRQVTSTKALSTANFSSLINPLLPFVRRIRAAVARHDGPWITAANPDDKQGIIRECIAAFIAALSDPRFDFDGNDV